MSGWTKWSISTRNGGAFALEWLEPLGWNQWSIWPEYAVMGAEMSSITRAYYAGLVQKTNPELANVIGTCPSTKNAIKIARAYCDELRIEPDSRILDQSLDLVSLENNHQELLGQMHSRGEQITCLCNNVGMAIHKRSRYFIYRLPKSGALHKPECPSYSEESDDDSDEVVVRLGFALSRFINQSGNPPVKKEGKREPAGASSHSKIITMRQVLTRYYKESGLGYPCLFISYSVVLEMDVTKNGYMQNLVGNPESHT